MFNVSLNTKKERTYGTNYNETCYAILRRLLKEKPPIYKRYQVNAADLQGCIPAANTDPKKLYSKPMIAECCLEHDQIPAVLQKLGNKP